MTAFGLAERGAEANRQTLASNPSPAALHFETSDNCLACHNSLTAPSGEDVSIGSAWRGSMMANSSRDPYWQASVRRETIDHPTKQAEIEDECSTCHMPMARATARARGVPGEVFCAPAGGREELSRQRLAADGVSCTLCHQIAPDRLGTRGELYWRVRDQAIDNGRPGSLWSFPHRSRPHARHALRCRRDTNGSHTHPAVRALRDLPYALHESAGARRRRGRITARAGAIPRVAAQRLSRRTQLPGLSHAGGRGADAGVLRARRAAAGPEPPRISSAATSSCSGC